MSQDTTLPPLPEPKASGLGDEYESFDSKGQPMGKAYANIDYFTTEQLHAYARAAIATQAQQPSPQEAAEIIDSFGQHHAAVQKLCALGYAWSGAAAEWSQQAQQAQGVPQDARKLLHIAQLAAAPQAEPQTPAPAQPSIQDLAAGAHYPQVTGWTNPAPRAEPAHTDDLAVDRFAARMKWKLGQKRNQGRSGWQDRAWTPEMISQALREHIEKGDPIDVANYCMFLAARNEPITPAEPQPELDAQRWRETLMRVGATRNEWVGGGHMFMVNIQAPPDVMQGSVAQHFTAAIDAARGAA